MTRIKRLVSKKKLAVRILPITLIILATTLGVVGVSQIVNQAGAAGNVSGTYFDHVVIIVMEEHGMKDICAQNPPPCSSSNGDPYIAGLANTYGIATRYLGVSHFSQADYIALLGGGTYGCVSYPCQPSSHANLVDRLETAGLSWKGYMENQTVASGCDTNYNQPYTPEHNPFVFFTDITSSAALCGSHRTTAITCTDIPVAARLLFRQETTTLPASFPISWEARLSRQNVLLCSSYLTRAIATVHLTAAPRTAFTPSGQAMESKLALSRAISTTTTRSPARSKRTGSSPIWDRTTRLRLQ
jgi:hypothetical protein